MSAAYEIPLSAQAQTFAITLAGTAYSITVFWSVMANAWILNLDTASATPVIHGIPLVTGADLLEQYAYLELGGALIVQTDYATDDIPTLANLGSDSHLYFVVK